MIRSVWFYYRCNVHTFNLYTFVEYCILVLQCFAFLLVGLLEIWPQREFEQELPEISFYFVGRKDNTTTTSCQCCSVLQLILSRPSPKYRFWAPGRVGSGRERKNNAFQLKSFEKRNAFERQGGLGAAGDGKTTIFDLRRVIGE